MGKITTLIVSTVALGSAVAGGYYLYRKLSEECPSKPPPTATTATATTLAESDADDKASTTATAATGGSDGADAAVRDKQQLGGGGGGGNDSAGVHTHPSSAPAASSPSPASGDGEPINESELAAVLDASLKNIQETGNADTPRERKLLKKLQSIGSYERLSAPCRFVIAQWCHTVFCTRTAAQYNPSHGSITLDQALQVRDELKRTYLDSAWTLLEMGGFDELAAESAGADAETRQVIQESVSRSAALKLDIACRMHDAALMGSAYKDAVRQAEKSDKPMDANDKLVLLASAALTGRCDEVVRLGGGVGRAELDVLHSAALKDPSMVDYGALYLLSLKIVEEMHRLQKQQGGADGAEPLGFTPGLAWEAYTVNKTRFRLQSPSNNDAGGGGSSSSGGGGGGGASASQSGKSDGDTAAAAPGGGGGGGSSSDGKPEAASASNPAPLRPGVTTDKWTEQSAQSQVNLIRTGALVHYVNPGSVPIPLSGFGTEREIRLFGYVDVQDSGGREQMRHMDMFKLEQDAADPKMWRGTESTTLFCVSGPRKGTTLATSTLHVEFEMEPDRSAIWKVL